MNRDISEIEAISLLKHDEGIRNAESVLARPAISGRWLTSMACVAAAGLGSYLLRVGSLPDEARGLLIGLFAGVVGLGIENWIMSRRLEAAIQLITIRETQNRESRVAQRT